MVAFAVSSCTGATEVQLKGSAGPTPGAEQGVGRELPAEKPTERPEPARAPELFFLCEIPRLNQLGILSANSQSPQDSSIAINLSLKNVGSPLNASQPGRAAHVSEIPVLLEAERDGQRQIFMVSADLIRRNGSAQALVDAKPIDQYLRFAADQLGLNVRNYGVFDDGSGLILPANSHSEGFELRGATQSSYIRDINPRLYVQPAHWVDHAVVTFWSFDPKQKIWFVRAYSQVAEGFQELPWPKAVAGFSQLPVFRWDNESLAWLEARTDGNGIQANGARLRILNPKEPQSLRDYQISGSANDFLMATGAPLNSGVALVVGQKSDNGQWSSVGLETFALGENELLKEQSLLLPSARVDSRLGLYGPGQGQFVYVDQKANRFFVSLFGGSGPQVFAGQVGRALNALSLTECQNPSSVWLMQ